MSILIKGMTMPLPGEHYLLLTVNRDGTAILEGQHFDYQREPFKCVPVPTPHGRLIDADELKNREIVIDYDEIENDFSSGLVFVADLIDQSHTIIEAEGEDK